MGHLCLRLAYTDNLKFQNVLHCPSVTRPLLSVSQMDTGSSSDGAASLFCDGVYYLLPKSSIRPHLDSLRSASVGIGHQNAYSISFTPASVDHPTVSDTPDATLSTVLSALISRSLGQ